MNQNDGQNKLGNNNPNQGVPNNQNGSSFNVPKHDAPHAAHSNGSFQDSLSKKPTKLDDEGPRATFDKAKEVAKNKIIDAIPGGRQAKKLMEVRNKTNNVLQNIRANKGPQLPPKRENIEISNENKRENKSSLDNNNDNNEFGRNRPSFLPRKPKFLDNTDEDDENEEQDASENQGGLSVSRGRGKKSKGDSLSYLAAGFLKMSPITKLILLVVITLIPLMIFFMAMSPLLVFNSTSAIGIADNNDSYKASKAEKKFQERIKEVQDEYSEDGKSFEAKYIGAVYTILSNYGKGYTYKKMTKSKIREIADLMFDENGSFSEDTFKENLQNSYFPSKIPGKSEETYKRYVDDMFDILKYYDDNKNRNKTSSTGTTGDVCTYDIKGMNTEQYGTGIKNKNVNATDIKVRLMSAGGMCDGTYGQPIEGEELVPLEKYILGVSYAENGDAPEEAFKAQLVVARSFVLSVADASGNAGGKKLVEEDGQWILQITNCVTDQVYCDPDEGCSKNGPRDNQYLVVHSGMKASTQYKPAMPENDQRRQWASEVAGKVALDSSGRLYLTNFKQSDQSAWNTMANQGMDYTQIILKHYPGVASISDSDCTDSSTGDGSSAGSYVGWKQSDSRWKDVVLGGGTDSSRSIGNIGCLATSISMLIAKSGAIDSLPTGNTLKGNFNPGTFVEAMNKTGGFDSGGNLYWENVSKAVPNFVYDSSSKQTLSGLSKDDKLRVINNKISQPNTYCVVEVKGGQGQHWVAIDSVNGTNIKMLDPGSKATNLWKEYDYKRTSMIQCFKKK